MVTDKEEQLLASSINNIAKLVRTELQWQGGPLPNLHRPLKAHITEAQDEELEVDGLMADSKPPCQ
jgi:hypothetical protein